MASNKRSLKSYVRFDGTGRVIAGSNILQRFKPKVGKWKQTQAYECCNDIVLAGDWNLITVYLPPLGAGLLNFPNHVDNVGEINPNLVGNGEVMLYINTSNLATEVQPELVSLPGKKGYLTLTQGVNSVTYKFLGTAFQYSTGIVSFDTIFGTSPAGSLQILIPSAGSFNIFDPISIKLQYIDF